MSLARNAVTVGSGTLLSRLLAYGRDAGIAALLGSTLFAEAFFAMFQIINFFRRLLADGALNSAFVPLWLKLRAGDGGAGAANRFTLRSLLVMFCITGILALVVIMFAWSLIGLLMPGFDRDRVALAGYLLMLASPYILFAGLVAVVAAALNADNRVGAVVASTIAFNVVMVAVVVLGFREERVTFAVSLVLAFAITIAGLVQFIIVMMAWLVSARPWRSAPAPERGQTALLFKRAVPGLIAAGVPQLKLIAAAVIVSGAPAAVSWLYYANRLYELPLGVVSIIISAVIVSRIAQSLHDGDSIAFTRAQSRAFELVIGLSLPAGVGFALLAKAIAGGLFERGAFNAEDTMAVGAALAAICAGLPGHAIDKVFGAISFAHEDTRTPMLTALGGLAVAIVAGIGLNHVFGYVGAAAAIALSAWIGAGLLGIVLYRRGWLRLDRDAARRLALIVLAAIVMGGAIALGLWGATFIPPAWLASSLARLGLALGMVAFGFAVYVATLQATGAIRMRELVTAIRQGT